MPEEGERTVDSWEAIRAECAACQKCVLGETRHNVVFGTGNPRAPILFVGEGPGEQEDLQGEPFVGPAGRFLDDMLSLIHLERSRDFYITNIVKCRPPRNRDPLGPEQDACIGYLRRQTALMRPRIIVCLGRIAAMRLIKPDFRITREHGQWFTKSGVEMTALYHPSALLRDPAKRPETFEDLVALREKILSVCPQVYEGRKI